MQAFAAHAGQKGPSKFKTNELASSAMLSVLLDADAMVEEASERVFSFSHLLVRGAVAD